MNKNEPRQFTAAELRKAWHAAFVAEHGRNIESATKAGAAAITAYFDAVGWGAWLREQPGCSAGYVRRQGSGVDYCGHVIGAVGLRIGNYIEPGVCHDVRLKYDVARFLLPSTLRMTDAAKYRQAGIGRMDSLPAAAVQPFDIVTVKTTANKAYGDHFVMVSEVTPTHIITLEGNASGTLANGKKGVHGVVANARPLEDIRRVYRFELDAFVRFRPTPYAEV